LADEGLLTESTLNLVKVTPTGADLSFFSVDVDDPMLAQYLLSCMADPNAVNIDGQSALEYAMCCMRFDYIACAILSSDRFKVDGIDVQAAFFEACKKGCPRVAKHLLQRFPGDVDINYQGPTGVNCFWAACVSGSEATVNMLLGAASEFGEDPDDQNPIKESSQNKEATSSPARRLDFNVMATFARGQAFTGFWLACRSGRFEIVKLLLLGSGSAEDAGTPAPWVPKLGVDSRGELDRNMDLPIRFTTPFQAALLSGNIDLVRFLFQHGSRFGMTLDMRDESDSETGTTFQLACCYPAKDALVSESSGYLGMAQDGSELGKYNAEFSKVVLPLLLDHLFSLITEDRSKCIMEYTQKGHAGAALWWACNFGNLGGVKVLIHDFVEASKQAALHCKYRGSTPLWIACCQGHVDVVRFLVTELGDNPQTETHVNSDGCSPFEAACAFSRLDVVRELLPVINRYCEVHIHLGDQSQTISSWAYSLLKVTCVVPCGVLCSEDLDCHSSVDRCECLKLLLDWGEGNEDLPSVVEAIILPCLRALPFNTFRGRHVVVNDIAEWIKLLESRVDAFGGRKRKSDETSS